MKKLLCFLLITSYIFSAYSQSVGIGTTTPHSSAALDINSSNKGVLLTRLTSAQRKSIATPATGLLVFDTDKNCLMLYDGVQWLPLVSTSLTNLPPVERVPTTISRNDRFGFAVAISGNYAVVGAPTDSVGDDHEQGSAYVYERVNGNWIQAAQLVASDGFTGDRFGYAVSISGDYIAVGAPWDDSGFLLNMVSDHGTVYIFHRVANTWVQEFKLRADDYSTDDFFSHSLSINNDKLMVGAPRDDNGAISGCGSIYFYQRNGTAWTQVNKFFRPSALAFEEFGSSVRLNGSYAIAGAPFVNVNGNNSGGAAVIYVFGGSTWNWQATILSPNSALNYFGHSVDINSDYAVVGLGYDGNGGRIYTYQRTGSSWNYLNLLTHPGPSVVGFGRSVSLSGNYMIVGRDLDRNNSCTLFKLTQVPYSDWEFVREISYSRPEINYTQENFYPDKNMVALDGENCVFGHCFLGINGYRSGAVLFLNISD